MLPAYGRAAITDLSNIATSNTHLARVHLSEFHFVMRQPQLFCRLRMHVRAFMMKVVQTIVSILFGGVLNIFFGVVCLAGSGNIAHINGRTTLIR